MHRNPADQTAQACRLLFSALGPWRRHRRGPARTRRLGPPNAENSQCAYSLLLTRTSTRGSSPTFIRWPRARGRCAAHVTPHLISFQNATDQDKPLAISETPQELQKLGWSFL